MELQLKRSSPAVNSLYCHLLSLTLACRFCMWLVNTKASLLTRPKGDQQPPQQTLIFLPALTPRLMGHPPPGPGTKPMTLSPLVPDESSCKEALLPITAPISI